MSGILGVKVVGGQHVLNQTYVLLLHSSQAYGVLPVHPIVLSLLEVGCLLGVLAIHLNRSEEVNQDIAVELPVLPCEHTARCDQLVRLGTCAEFVQLVGGDIHTDLLSLILERVLGYQHLPYLIADLRMHILIKVAAA